MTVHSAYAFHPEKARAFLVEHDLGFLDLCELVLALAGRCPYGMVKWNHPRALVHIKMLTRSVVYRGAREELIRRGYEKPTPAEIASEAAEAEEALGA